MAADLMQALTVSLAVIALLGFLAMFGWGIIAAWRSSPPNKPGEPFTYVATALAALVGGVVAVAFGQKPPKFLATVLSRKPQELLIATYAVGYITFSAAAVVTWVVKPVSTPTLVKNLGTTFLGILLPVVTNYLQP